ncbi:Hypothetical protein ACA1_192610 [Acanthamoeba castellanii str. Neff]|uniref:Uncharacterized protein n=1 Tax=Acanthamoeba castellanii (strain ATCC 30010 / Neff) TaxID=1257118 RepID=L8GN48_ACACF|nr:Hypothetical protein ACA1_192610 [Acanthamoeba castellanii str. Neff]ELR14490.1 Hypothetical protein ACA1_192610 [Acanthamoeba castellanii str. Neff]
MGGFDWKRTGRLMAYGFLASGPMMHGWYKALDAAIPSASFKASIVKLCLDQSIAAPTLIASFFVVVGAMEGKSRAELEEKMRRDYLATMKVNWSVWPLISFINFRFIPPAQRVLYVSCVSVLWNAYLSWVNAR